MTILNQDQELVNTLKVACDGSSTKKSEGHPKVWLKIPEDIGHIRCPYCEKKFVFEQS